jgi:peptidoglycan/LPS O-acetylase OafA/YrhL
LLHAYVGIILIGLFTRQLGAPDLVAALAATLICVALSWGLTTAVEQPAKRALLDWGRSRLDAVNSRLPIAAFAPTAAAAQKRAQVCK